MGRRRSNGEGTLFKRKDGRWSAQAYVKLSSGATKRVCITGRDHETVKKKLREALEQANRNIPYIEKEWTVANILIIGCARSSGGVSVTTLGRYVAAQ